VGRLAWYNKELPCDLKRVPPKVPSLMAASVLMQVSCTCILLARALADTLYLSDLWTLTFQCGSSNLLDGTV